MASTARNSTSFRLYLLAGLFVLWCCGICARLVYLQIFRYGTFEQRAQRQRQRSEEVSPRRGIIYDRFGNELAMSINVDSIFAVPTEMPKPSSTMSLLARITKQDPRELMARCEASKTFCWVARKPDPEISERIRSLNLRGIYFQKESKRYYPKGDLAAQVLGYVGMDDKGLSGIEREYEDQLHGRPGQMLVSVDARKKYFGSVEKQPEPGQNIVLTLDEKIQYIAERELETAMEQTRAIAGTVVVENPRTGEILALANRPTFNANLSKEITPERLKNHAVSDVYEPGSTFKLVTIAGALEEKVTRPDELFDCQMGSIVYNGMRIRDSKPHGVLSVADVLAESSDVGSIKIGLRLGEDRFYKYIRGFGFGQQTGIELPGETRGLTKPPNRWSKVSIAAISMGQEIAITPLQLVGLISTMANDGMYVAPRIVAATTQPQSAPQTIAFHAVDEHRIISPLTAAQMRQMMQGVVLHGTGKKALLIGYTSAGKTGTAQKVDPATRAYSHTKYVATFAGFAPVNNPAVTIAVVLDSAVGLHQGGQVSAPVFNRIAQQVLEYLHTPHDIEIPANKTLLARAKVSDKDFEEGSPDHPGENIDELQPMADTLADSKPQQNSRPNERIKPPISSGPAASGTVVVAAMRQSEASGATEKPGRPIASPQPVSVVQNPTTETVVVDVEQGGIVVPSFVGKSVRSSIEIAQDSGLELNVVGSGKGLDQSPPAGSHVASGARITVRFGR
ncbi:MAG TPA: penicillin-binding transpeptidase domain-containing protein [Terriglobales bacterium]|nr:penicillin-binding transpeptidase domain-containing protein [Terriglobales bacterium]